MPNLTPKILVYVFLIIFAVQLGGLVLLSARPLPVLAATEVNYTPQVQGLDYEFKSSYHDTRNIANYIDAIYRYAIGIVGIVAAVVLMFGGVLWIVAAGNTSRISEAKAWIGAALTGLILALTSYLILDTINPALVNLEITNVSGVSEAKTGACYFADDFSTSKICIDGYTKEQCTEKYKNNADFRESQTCPPKACCLYNYKFVPGGYMGAGGYSYWEDCANNLTKAECQKMPGGGTYIEKKECQKVNSRWDCVVPK